jgi:hypothetical protein
MDIPGVHMKYIVSGTVLCLLSIGLIVSNKYQLLAGIILVVGVWLGIKGCNKLDSK